MISAGSGTLFNKHKEAKEMAKRINDLCVACCDGSLLRALQQQEEREKTMLLQKAEALRRERALMKELARAEDDHLRAMAEENRHKFKEQMEKLTAEISALKMEAAGESSSQQGGIKRKWECVMCLTEPKSVIFLPCAHQALYTACNMLHERTLYTQACNMLHETVRNEGLSCLPNANHEADPSPLSVFLQKHTRPDSRKGGAGYHQIDNQILITSYPGMLMCFYVVGFAGKGAKRQSKMRER
nr:putative E3 ubiquitin-protein ligase RF298 [Ipomoea batatas]